MLAGKATDEARPWLERIARAAARRRVRHIGYVEPAKRQALYEGARLLVQPSFEEGFGIPVLEAMTLGVPVVAANRGALPEVLGDAGLLVDPDDARRHRRRRWRACSTTTRYAASLRSERARPRARPSAGNDTAHGVYDAYRQAIERRQEPP